MPGLDTTLISFAAFNKEMRRWKGRKKGMKQAGELANERIKKVGRSLHHAVTLNNTNIYAVLCVG